MADLNEFKQELKKLLSGDNGVEKVVKKLQGKLILGSMKSATLEKLAIQDVANRREWHLGEVSISEYRTTSNRISSSLIDFITDLNEGDFNSSASKNPPQTLSRVKYYTCNRRRVKNKFKSRLKEKIAQKQNCHFYFLSSTKGQMPESLINRLIFEELDKSEWKIRYETEKGVTSHESIKVHEFPQEGFNLEYSKIEIRARVENTFGFSAYNLQELIHSNPTLRQYDYVVRVFGLQTTKNRWQPFTIELFDWIISEYCQVKESYNTTFLLFFILYLEPRPRLRPWHFRYKKSHIQKITEGLKALEQKYSERCTCLPILQHVPRQDFEEWLQRHIFEMDLIKAQEYVKNIIRTIKKLPYKEQIEIYDEQQQGFSMSLVESKIRDLINEYKRVNNPIKKRL